MEKNITAIDKWEQTTLGEICNMRGGTVFPRVLQGKHSGKYPFIKVSDMNLPENATCILGANNYVDEADLSQLKVKPFPEDSTVFAKIGEGLKQNRLRFLVVPTIIDNNMMCAIPVIERVDSRFFFYALSQFDFGRFAEGTALPYLTVDVLSRLSLYLPSLSNQHAIAHILSTLDDKIELNRQVNETLEAIARAIFKSWFVDFDPAKAKMEGRKPPCMDTETAALFPSAFQDSSLGKIPHGWQVLPLPEVIEVNPRRVLKKGTIAPYLHMQNLPTQGHRPNDWTYREFNSGTKFTNGDTLLARITPCLENGKTGFVDFLDEDEVGWGSTEYIILRPKPPLPVEFGYYLARSDDLRMFAIHNMTGTTGRQRVPASCFDYYQFAVPSAPITQKFSKIVKPLMEKIRVNNQQSHTLSQTRDTLLPKLLSGEIRVDNANEILEKI